MKKVKKILSLALALCLMASMLVFTSVTSNAFGISLSPGALTVDKAVSTTCTVTCSVDYSDESGSEYGVITWTKSPSNPIPGADPEFVPRYTDNWGSSITSPATWQDNGNGNYTINVSEVAIGTTVEFSRSARFYYGYAAFNAYTNQRTAGNYWDDRPSNVVRIYVTCSHTNRWDSGTVTTAPSCTTNGVKTYTCSACGGTRTEPVDPLDHDFKSKTPTETYLRTAATCTAAATYFYKCSRCDEKGTEYYSYGEALGHLEYSQIDVAPTPNSTGIRGYYCSRCNERLREEIIPILTGIDVTIYYARQVIDENNNNELLTGKDGYTEAWESFDTAYNAALQYEGAEVTQDNEAAIDAADTALYNQIINMRNYEVLDTSALEEAIALEPSRDAQDYEENSYTVWYDLHDSAVTFLEQAMAIDHNDKKTRADESEMMTLADGLTRAYNALKIRPADFSALNAALLHPNVVNKDRYKPEARATLEGLLAQVDFTKTKDEQLAVNKLAEDIEEAAANLKEDQLDYADYSQIEEALREIAQDLEIELGDNATLEDVKEALLALETTDYTNFDIVQDAINAVNWTTLRIDQDLVDDMAFAINTARENLVLKGADYTSVTNAIAAAQAKDSSMYLNYYRVQNLIDSVDLNKNIRQQDDVDAMAAEILTAINELEYKPADFTNVDAALDSIAAELGNLDDYTEESLAALDAAVGAVDYTVTIERQSDVDAMAATLNSVINDIKNNGLKPADYSLLERTYEEACSLDEGNYANFDVVLDVINSIDWNKNIREQSDVDAMRQTLIDAMRQLQPVGANYTQVDAAIAAVQEMIDENVDDLDETSVAQYYEFLETINRDLTVFDQDTVDAYAEQILAAGAAIEYKAADYSAVTAAVQQAQNLNRQNYVDFSEVTSAVVAVEYGLKINRQAEVDAMATAILDAIDALELKDADYSYVNSLIEQFNNVNENYYNAQDIAAVETVIETTVVRGYKIDRQSDVDAMAQTIYQALRGLETKMLLADTTALNAAISTAIGRVNEMQQQGYDIVPEQLTNLYNLIDEAESMEGSYIDVQSNIDALTQTILDAAQSLEFVFTITDETTAVIDGEYVYGFEEGITAEEIESMFSYVGTANIRIEETDKGLGTGSRVIFTDENGEELDSFTVIIFGDADGDGWIDMFDVSITSEIANYELEDVSEEMTKALDVNLDGFVDAYDMSIILNIANMEAGISQDGTCTIE